MNVESQTPLQIDTQISDLVGKRREAERRRSAWLRDAEYAQKNADRLASRGEDARAKFVEADVAKYLTKYDEQGDIIDAIDNEIAPLDAEYIRRGRWTRAFLVTNSGGHVHSSLHCSTCFPTTEFLWLVDYADHDEAQIVADAGERACTVCYPSAPVEVLARPTKIFSPDEKAAQVARENRAAKTAARDAAKITVTLPHEVRVGGGHQKDGTWSPVEYGVVEKVVTYKTLRALQNDAGAVIRRNHGAYAGINGFSYPDKDVEAQKQAQEVLVAALAEHGIDVEEFVAKQVKRAQKER